MVCYIFVYLSFDLDSWDTIVTKLKHDIKIFYKDNTEITEDLNLVLIKFRNTGNEPIKKMNMQLYCSIYIVSKEYLLRLLISIYCFSVTLFIQALCT